MTRLIIYNIEYCEGTIKGIWQYLDLYHVFRARKFLDQNMVEYLKDFKPDVLALIEVDSGSVRSKHVNESQFFSESLNLNNMAHITKYSVKGFFNLFNKLPILKHQENSLLSKHKLENVKYHYLSKGSKRVVIEATIKLKKKVTILIVHLALFKKTRLKQLHDLVKIVNNIKNPVILAGDFNTFKVDELNILLDNTNLVDAYSFNKTKQKFTEPSWKPKYRLDNILVSPEIKIKNYEILEAHFSDHLPVMVDFDLK